MSNTTSGAYQFDQDFSIDEIISDAYERIGLVGTSGHQLKTARRSLNILFQEWGNRGAHFWEIGNTNIDLVVGSTTNVNATVITTTGEDETSCTVEPCIIDYGFAIFFIVFGSIALIAGVASNVYVQIHGIYIAQ